MLRSERGVGGGRVALPIDALRGVSFAAAVAAAGLGTSGVDRVGSGGVGGGFRACRRRGRVGRGGFGEGCKSGGDVLGDRTADAFFGCACGCGIDGGLLFSLSLSIAEELWAVCRVTRVVLLGTTGCGAVDFAALFRLGGGGDCVFRLEGLSVVLARTRPLRSWRFGSGLARPAEAVCRVARRGGASSVCDAGSGAPSARRFRFCGGAISTTSSNCRYPNIPGEVRLGELCGMIVGETMFAFRTERRLSGLHNQTLNMMYFTTVYRCLLLTCMEADISTAAL